MYNAKNNTENGFTSRIESESGILAMDSAFGMRCTMVKVSLCSSIVFII